MQVCYNLVNFLQRDEQDKQGRIDYLKGLAESEAKQVGGGACMRCCRRLRPVDRTVRAGDKRQVSSPLFGSFRATMCRSPAPLCQYVVLRSLQQW